MEEIEREKRNKEKLVEMKEEIEKWRWEGVKLYMRKGKRIEKSV